MKETLLMEKVTRDELSDALSNPNVRIGAEFEFIASTLNQDDLNKKWIEYNDYLTLLTNWEDSDTDEDPPEAPMWMQHAGYESGDPDFPLFDLIAGTSKNSRFISNSNKFLKENPTLFSKGSYIISNDEKKRSKNKFIIKPDGSLGLEGIEVTTPIMKLDDFLDFCPKMFEAINKSATTTEDCGFHVSISLANVPNLQEFLDIVKMMVFFDEGYIYEHFDMRRFNIFAKSAHHKLYSEITRNPESIIDYIGKKKEFFAYHHDAINMEHLSTDNKYIEFRYVGGQDYHRKWDRIKSIIGRYIYSLSIACDPEYKTKEYLKKLVRIYNKLALFSVVQQLNDLIKDGKKDTKEYKDLVETWRALNIYKKGSKQSEDTETNFKMLANKFGLKYINKMKWNFE